MNTVLNTTVGPRARAWLWQSLGLLAALVCASVAATALLLHGLKARDGEWSTPVRVGPWPLTVTTAVSMPSLIRLALHPLAQPWLTGRAVSTRAGRWVVMADRDGVLQARCSPCTLRLRTLGDSPVTVGTAWVRVRRAEPEAWRGSLSLSPHLNTAAVEPADPASVTLQWHGQLRADGLRLTLQLPDTDVAALVALQAHAMPREAHARVRGQMGFELTAMLNAQGLSQLQLKPRLHGVEVGGLDTEALRDVDVQAGCVRDDALLPEASARTVASGLEADATRARITGWLPRAVIAAEDQRFFEHPGFDLQESLLAWSQNQADADRRQAPRGASTLTQQLAKLVYVGDERSAVRKLREWLYAVEMERTLGKARILQLYLALVPWGDGVCGAQAAASQHLQRAPSALQPHQAAWLATLLRNPQVQLDRSRQRGRIDEAATTAVIKAMRPLPRERRETAIDRLSDFWPAALRHHKPLE
jgi:hypothetical protein